MAFGSDQLGKRLKCLDIHEDEEPFYDALSCADQKLQTRQTMCTGNYPHRGSQTEEICFNHLIFSRILKACDVETLKCLRLVCFAWYQASLETWRQVSVLRLSNWDSETDTPSGYLSPSKFLQLMTCPPPDNVLYFARFPPQSLRLLKWNILELHADRRKEELWFWNKMSRVLKYLCLDTCSFSLQNFYKLLYGLFLLEHLKMNSFGRLEESLQPTSEYPINYNVKTVEFVGSTPFKNWDFLQVFPNLEAIHMQDFSKNYLFEDLRKLRYESGFTTHALKTVDIIGTSQRLQGLVEAHFPLTHLTLRLNLEATETELKGILKVYGKNLETLKLFQFPIAWSSYAPFKEFPFEVEFSKLKELELWGNVITSFNVLKSTPLLETLKVDLQCFEKMREIEYWRSRKDRMVTFQGEHGWGEGSFGVEEMDGVKLDKMHTLEIDYKFGRKSMKVLGSWMPNLKRLATVLNKDTLEVVCGQWPNLKELRLGFGSEVDDNGITGPVKYLRKLETFELASFCGQSILTDVAIRDGFMKMETLSNLKICVSPKVSLACEEELLDSGAIENVALFRNYGEGPHFNDFQCCRRAAFLKRNAEMAYN